MKNLAILVASTLFTVQSFADLPPPPHSKSTVMIDGDAAAILFHTLTEANGPLSVDAILKSPNSNYSISTGKTHTQKTGNSTITIICGTAYHYGHVSLCSLTEQMD